MPVLDLQDQPEAGPSTATLQQPIPLAQGSKGRTSGKFWKDDKTANRRSHLIDGLKTKNWSKHVEEMNREKATRRLIREMKEEREQAEKDRKNKIVERRKAKEEKMRLEIMKTKMNAKKLMRLRKKQGRVGNINH